MSFTGMFVYHNYNKLARANTSYWLIFMFMIRLKTSSSFKWPVRSLKHNYIKNRYPLIIQRFLKLRAFLKESFWGDDSLKTHSLCMTI